MPSFVRVAEAGEARMPTAETWSGSAGTPRKGHEDQGDRVGVAGVAQHGAVHHAAMRRYIATHSKSSRQPGQIESVDAA